MFYTNVKKIGSKLHEFYIDNSGQKKYRCVKFQPTLAFPSTHKTGWKTIYGKDAKRKKFENIWEANDFLYRHRDTMEIYGDIDPEYQYIRQQYIQKRFQPDHTKVKKVFYDIETRIGPNRIDVMAPDQPINSIALKDDNEGIFYVGATKKYQKDKNELGIDPSKIKFKYSETEQDLLIWYINVLKRVKPDILSGWFCIPTDSLVWKIDRIIKMDELSYKDRLYGNRRYVENIFPVSKKRKYSMLLNNGDVLYSSEDHRFPVLVKKIDRYIDPLNAEESMINMDIPLKDIDTSKNSYYIKTKINNMDRETLTFRDLFSKNLKKVNDKGVNIYFRDPLMVKKVSAILKRAVWEELKQEFWSYNNLIDIVGEKELVSFIDRNNEIYVWLSSGRTRIKVSLDDEITQKMLWLMGMWMSDGTQAYKTEISIYNTNEDILNAIDICVRSESNVIPSTKLDKRDGCSRVVFGKTSLWGVLKILICDSAEAKSNKNPDVELLSQLSKKQFLSLLAGWIDGDGMKDGIITSNSPSILDSISSLCKWFGMFGKIWSTSIKIFFENDKIEFIKSKIVTGYKREGICPIDDIRNCAKSKDLSYFVDSNGDIYNRIISIDDTNEEVSMIDISTSDQYFIYNGFKSHNCNIFDNPYLTNRFDMIFQNGNKMKRLLSPLGFVKVKERMNNKGQTVYPTEYGGMSLVDYKDVCEKFDFMKMERWGLDFVAGKVLGEHKIDYSEYDNLNDLWEKNPQKYIDYNIYDVELLSRMEKKLKLFNLMTELTYYAGVNISDTMGTVGIWDVILYNRLSDKKIVIPPRPFNNEKESFAGGFVYKVDPNLYKWVLSFDLNSLYPHLQMQYNISPETIVDKAEEVNLYPYVDERFLRKEIKGDPNYILSGSGQYFSRERVGVIPETVSEIYDQRKMIKNRSLRGKAVATQIKAELARRGVQGY